MTKTIDPSLKGLAKYDPVLGPALKHTNGSARQRVLAVLVAGLGAGIKPALARRWILRAANGPEPDAAVLSYVRLPAEGSQMDNRRWRDVLEAALRYRRSPVLPIGPARLLVAHLLAPLDRPFDRFYEPVSARRQLIARAHLALLGLEIIDNCHGERSNGRSLVRPMDTALMAKRDFQMWLNRTNDTVVQRSPLALVEDLGWAHIRRGGKQGSAHRALSRWALDYLGPRQRDFVESEWPLLVEALAARDESDPVVEAIRLLRHPAWAYGGVAPDDRAPDGPPSLSITTWWCLVLLRAEVADLWGERVEAVKQPDGTVVRRTVRTDRYGVSPSTFRHAKKDLVSLMRGHETLAEALDAHDFVTGASAKKAVKEVARDEARERNLAELAEAKVERKARLDAQREARAAAKRAKRQTIRLPKGFDPSKESHMSRLLAMVTEEHGLGFAIEAVDLSEGTAVIALADKAQAA